MFTPKFISDYRPGPWGLLRIAMWTGLFLWLIGRLLPITPSFAPLVDFVLPGGTPLREVIMSVAKGDPRGYRTDHPPLLDRSPQVAWIGDSTTILSNPEDARGRPEADHLIPTEVAVLMGKHAPVMATYIKAGFRLYDKYLSTLYALDNNPDLIVITVNPLLLFNDSASQAFDNLVPGVVPHAGLSDWGSLLTHGTPAQLAWGAVAPVLPVLRDRTDYNSAISAWLKGHQLLDRAYLSTTEMARRGKGREGIPNANPALKFWIYHGTLGGKVEPQGKPGWQWQTMNHVRPDADTVNHQIFAKLLTTLKKSGVPALIYLAPPAPAIQDDPTLGPKLIAVERQFDEFAKQYQSDTLKLVRSYPPSVLQKIRFDDLIHLRHALPLSGFLARQIHQLLNPPAPKEGT
jgi:hypothetical protein